MMSIGFSFNACVQVQRGNYESSLHQLIITINEIDFRFYKRFIKTNFSVGEIRVGEI